MTSLWLLVHVTDVGGSGSGSRLTLDGGSREFPSTTSKGESGTSEGRRSAGIEIVFLFVTSQINAKLRNR